MNLSNFKTRAARLAFGLVLSGLVLGSILAAAQSAANPPVDPKTIPVVDGGIGPCTADFTITDAAGAPVYAAKIKVHIAYRFMSAHRLDLEVGTNADGKARFTGLPDRLKRSLNFQASEGERVGEVVDDTAKTCKAEFTVKLEKK
jgi:hypothetical protein